MSNRVIHLWGGPHEHRIRIPGPGEQVHEAKVIILPVVRIERHPPGKPRKRNPERKTP